MLISKKIFVNGSFDVLHSGHLDLLNYAKSLGSYLLVAIDSDSRIAQKKGLDRPFQNQNNRYYIMSMLKPVDEVKIFYSDQDLINIIAEYQPDVMVVGSDWRGKNIIGSQHSRSVIFFDRVNNESTTEIIESYLDRRHLC